LPKYERGCWSPAVHAEVMPPDRARHLEAELGDRLAYKMSREPLCHVPRVRGGEAGPDLARY